MTANSLFQECVRPETVGSTMSMRRRSGKKIYGPMHDYTQRHVIRINIPLDHSLARKLDGLLLYCCRESSAADFVYIRSKRHGSIIDCNRLQGLRVLDQMQDFRALVLNRSPNRVLSSNYCQSALVHKHELFNSSSTMPIRCL